MESNNNCYCGYHRLASIGMHRISHKMIIYTLTKILNQSVTLIAIDDARKVLGLKKVLVLKKVLLT